MTRSSPSSSPPSPQHPSPLRLQFNLKAMLALTAIVSGLLGTWSWFGVPAAAGFTLLTLAILAHMAGNSIGTRLRNLGSQSSQPHVHEVVDPRDKLDDSAFAPATALRDKQNLGSVTLIMTAVGVVIGGFLGAVVFLTVYWEFASLTNISAGVLAFGTLGGMGTFGAMSFAQVMYGAFSQAAQTGPPTNERARESGELSYDEPSGKVSGAARAGPSADRGWDQGE